MNETNKLYLIKVINIGLTPKEQGEIRKRLNSIETLKGRCTTVENHYNRINHTDITDYDALVLSPGNAPVGLLTTKRAAKYPGIKSLYQLIHTAVREGIPLIGINAGHEALNCAHGWAIDKIPDDEKAQYQTESEIDITGVTDIIAQKVNDITIKLSNGYGVLPRTKQKTRPDQDKVNQLVDHMGYPLISQVDSPAPVYGVQFDIEDGTKAIFENFFELCRSIRRE